MNIEVRQPQRGAKDSVKARVGIFDCDIHPKSSLEDLRPYLSNRWWDYLQTYGQRQRHGYVKGFPYPKSQPLASRRDSWPPGGGLPASDLDFMRQQHLDFYGIEWGVMNPLSPTGQGEQNDELSAAMAFAANEYQLEGWNRRDPRLKASVVVPYEDGEAVARGNPQARRRPPLRPCAVPEPHQRAARQAPLLADLRGGGRGRAAGRHARLRLQRPADEQHRLAVVLHRGDHRALGLAAGVGREPDRGGRVRALSRAQDRADRGGLRLDARARLAPRPELEAHEGRGPASASARRRNICASISGSRPSRWRRPRSPTT